MSGQVAINALVSGSSYVLAGISFLLPFLVAQFFHFSHGAAYAVGAYTTFALMRWGDLGLVGAVLGGVIVAAACGGVSDRLFYRRMHGRGASAFVLLLASLGVYILSQNALSLFFGDSAVAIPGSRDWAVYDVPGGRITTVQSLQVLAAAVIAPAVWLFLRHTATGKRMIAVGQNRNLAFALGIDCGRTSTIAFALGYGLAGIAGIIAACNVDLTPTMGMRPMMLGMVAMIIGGNTLWGTVLGALLLGFAQHFGVVFLPTQWQDAIAFLILLLFLLFRPQGFQSGAENRTA